MCWLVLSHVFLKYDRTTKVCTTRPRRQVKPTNQRNTSLPSLLSLDLIIFDEDKMGLFGKKGEEAIPGEDEAGIAAILSQLMEIVEAAALRVEDKVPHTILAALAVAFVVRLVVKLSIWHSLSLLLEYITHPVPDISESIGLEPAEADDDGIESKPGTGSISLVDKKKPGRLQCFDPSTLQLLGDVPAMTAAEVNELCAKAKQAQKSWSQTTYAERRVVLRTIQKYIVNHIEEICRVCTRDSGAYYVVGISCKCTLTCILARVL